MTVIVEQRQPARRPNRKPKQAVHQVMVRLEPELFHRLSEMAGAERRSLANLGALAIKRFMDEQPELTT